MTAMPPAMGGLLDGLDGNSSTIVGVEESADKSLPEGDDNCTSSKIKKKQPPRRKRTFTRSLKNGKNNKRTPLSANIPNINANIISSIATPNNNVDNNDRKKKGRIYVTPNTDGWTTKKLKRRIWDDCAAKQSLTDKLDSTQNRVVELEKQLKDSIKELVKCKTEMRRDKKAVNDYLNSQLLDIESLRTNLDSKLKEAEATANSSRLEAERRVIAERAVTASTLEAMKAEHISALTRERHSYAALESRQRKDVAEAAVSLLKLQKERRVERQALTKEILRDATFAQREAAQALRDLKMMHHQERMSLR